TASRSGRARRTLAMTPAQQSATPAFVIAARATHSPVLNRMTKMGERGVGHAAQIRRSPLQRPAETVTAETRDIDGHLAQAVRSLQRALVSRSAAARAWSAASGGRRDRRCRASPR